MKTKTIFYLLGIPMLLCCKESIQKEISVEETGAFAVKAKGILCTEGTADIEWYMSQSKAPILDGLDVLNYPITTSNTESQKYFNQGLMLAYGFNHAEAARSFYEAARLDPECAMCHWGYAYVLGPNYNAGMEPGNYERAYESIQKALALSDKVKPHEQELIAAMASRYAPTPPDDRFYLDQAYAEEMKEVYKHFPQDAEIACLYAEAMMNLHPWDLYTEDGYAKEWTPEILNALENVLKINPNHPGSHHFYIHAVEASNAPEKGYASARQFDQGLVPGSGHLIHMPSHIYIRSGDYNKGLQANIKAVKIDSQYVSNCHAQGAYPLGYYPHNIHFIAACAAYAGNQYWAVKGSNSVSDHAHRDLMKEPGWGTLQHYYVIPYFIAVKFARWDDILNMKNFDTNLKYPEAVRHFARGMAYLGKNDITKAEDELARLEFYSKDESLKEVTIWDINNTYTILQIARRVLKAELLGKKRQYKESIALLKEAVEIEDNLNYQEPTDWLLPVRHHLGAIFIDAGAPKDAIVVYKRDLYKLPKNCWALQGLKNAYMALDLEDQGAEIQIRLEEAMEGSDIEINSSRIW